MLLKKRIGKKTAASNRRLFQKVFVTLGCVLGLLFLLVPSQVPASSGGQNEWEIVLPGGHIQDSSPTLADIDGDNKDEIIIGTTNNPSGAAPVLAVLEDDGSIKWSKTLDHAMGSAPAVVDISSPSDNIPEIIITTGVDIQGFSAPGSVIAFDNNGNQLWRYDTNDAQGSNTPFGNFASAVAGDVDGDGDLEIVVASWDRNIYLLDHQGNYVWHYHVADTVWSTPVLVDLDNNDTLEIVLGTDIKGGGTLPDGYMPTDGGFILILDKDGNKLARRQMNESIYSSPAVGDADGDGDFEIFIGSGMFYYHAGNYTQPYVYGFDVDMSGQPDQYGSVWQVVDLPGWPKPVAYPGMSSPALADLDDDGDLEVVIGSGDRGGGSSDCSDSESDANCAGALYAWHHTGNSLSGFPMWPKEINGKNWPLRSSPTVGDVDGDGGLEIAVSVGWEVAIVGSNGTQELALHTDRTVLASPAIGDPDRDGQTNVIIGGGDAFEDTDKGHVYNFEFSGNTFNPGKLPWPQFHRDAQNSGLYIVPPAPEPYVSVDSLMILHQTGDTSSATSGFILGNRGAVSFNFNVTTTQSDVQVSPSSGEVAGGSSVSLSVSVNTDNLSPGSNSLGNIVITPQDSSGTTSLPNIQVPVTVIGANLSHLYIPVIIR